MTSMLFFQLSSPTHWRKEREQGSVLCFVAHWRLNMDKIFYYMFYPQDISSLWADIQSFSTPTLMGVIRGRQWSNKGVRCLLSASKAAILETEIPAGTFLCPVSHKSGCSWHSALLSSSKLHMVTLVWKSHIFLGQGQGVRNDFTAWNCPGSEIHTGTLKGWVRFLLFSYCLWGKWEFLGTHQGKPIHFTANLYCS